MKRFLALALTLALLLAGCGPTSPPSSLLPGGDAPAGPAPVSPQSVTITAGAIGGSWYMYGALFADLWETNISGLATNLIAGTGNSNPYVVSANEAQVGFSYVDVSGNAYAGTGVSPEKAENMNLLMNIGTTFYFTCLVDKSLGVRSFDDIKEKKPALVCAVGASGSGSEEVFRRVFEAHGITYDDIAAWGGEVVFVGGGAGADMFRDGQVNVLSNAAPQPYPTWVEVAASRDSVLLGVDESAREALKGFDYTIDQIETAPYRDDTGAVLSAGPTSVLVVNSQLDEEMVYEMTRLLYENFDKLIAVQSDLDDFVPENAASSLIPLHPGAERYYREIGLVQ